MVHISCLFSAHILSISVNNIFLRDTLLSNFRAQLVDIVELVSEFANLPQATERGVQNYMPTFEVLLELVNLTQAAERGI